MTNDEMQAIKGRVRELTLLGEVPHSRLASQVVIDDLNRLIAEVDWLEEARTSLYEHATNRPCPVCGIRYPWAGLWRHLIGEHWEFMERARHGLLSNPDGQKVTETVRRA